MKIKPFFTVLIVLFLVSSILFAEKTISIPYQENISVQDSIPNDGYLYDTLTVFDKDTYKERTVVYRTKIEGYRYDTLIVFDNETYEEYIKIEKVAYGSEKEIVKPASEEDKERKLLECYQIKWGPLKHNFVFGSSNRVIVNPKMISDVLKSAITIEGNEGCEPVTEIQSLNIIVQYDNGSTETIAQGHSAESHGKLVRNKRKTKEGTIYMLDKIIISFGDQTLQLPYVQFVVKK